jgi:hypothetical protein
MRSNSCKKNFKVCARREFRERKLPRKLLNKKKYVLAAAKYRSSWTKKKP